MNMPTRSTIAWFSMLALALFNGAIREILMKSLLGVQEPLANQLSCLTGILLLSSFTFLNWKNLRIRNVFQSCLIGMYWFLATMIFETFVINRKLSWGEIFQTYNVFEGNYWGLVLLWIGLMPIAFFLVKKPGK